MLILKKNINEIMPPKSTTAAHCGTVGFLCNIVSALRKCMSWLGTIQIKCNWFHLIIIKPKHKAKT